MLIWLNNQLRHWNDQISETQKLGSDHKKRAPTQMTGFRG